MTNIRLNAIRYLILVALVLSLLPAPVLAARAPAPAFQASTFPVPAVAIHVSELTQVLETTPASPPTPTGAGTTGYQWWPTSWHYFVMHESLKEALRSDGTPFVTVSDADIAAGRLLNPDGSPNTPSSSAWRPRRLPTQRLHHCVITCPQAGFCLSVHRRSPATLTGRPAATLPWLTRWVCTW